MTNLVVFRNFQWGTDLEGKKGSWRTPEPRHCEISGKSFGESKAPVSVKKKSKRKKEKKRKQKNKIGSIREKYHMAGSKSLKKVQEKLAVKGYPNCKDCNFGDVCNMEWKPGTAAGWRWSCPDPTR